MPSVRNLGRGALALLGLLVGPTLARADRGDEVGAALEAGRESVELAVELVAVRNDVLPDGPEEKSRKVFDYSRFSDGPRRVPKPRGAAYERAKALGLGTLEAAQHLLSRGPKPEWVRAARGKNPTTLLWPVEGGRFGRGYGFVREERRDLRHDGIDVTAEEGAVVRAVADGIVAYSDNGIRGFGNCVLIVHPNGWVSVYAHNQRTTVQAGWRVQRGERIAFVGSTGIARGPHLHFELRAAGRPLDPAKLFSRNTAPLEAKVEAKTASASKPIATALASQAAQTAGESTRSTAAADGVESRRTREQGEPVSGLGLGDISLVRALFVAPPPPELLASVEGRSFQNLLWPVRGGTLARSFSASHRGIDIAAEEGAAVRVAADGIVVYAGEALTGLGKAVVVVHPNGWVTVYGSNAELAVVPGQRVLRGEWIAKVGTSGASEGPHLHFEIYKSGQVDDPLPLLVQRPDAVQTP